MLVSAQIEDREEIHLDYTIQENCFFLKSLKGIGGPGLLKLLENWREKLKLVTQIPLPLPNGNSLEDMLLREVLLRAQNQWNPPYTAAELCHCRAVTTSQVEAAILTGAHDAISVSQLTSASTGCGTCRPNVEALIAYRLQKNDPTE